MGEAAELQRAIVEAARALEAAGEAWLEPWGARLRVLDLITRGRAWSGRAWPSEAVALAVAEAACDVARAALAALAGRPMRPTTTPDEVGALRRVAKLGHRFLDDHERERPIVNAKNEKPWRIGLIVTDPRECGGMGPCSPGDCDRCDERWSKEVGRFRRPVNAVEEG